MKKNKKGKEGGREMERPRKKIEAKWKIIGKKQQINKEEKKKNENELCS